MDAFPAVRVVRNIINLLNMRIIAAFRLATTRNRSRCGICRDGDHLAVNFHRQTTRRCGLGARPDCAASAIPLEFLSGAGRVAQNGTPNPRKWMSSAFRRAAVVGCSFLSASGPNSKDRVQRLASITTVERYFLSRKGTLAMNLGPDCTTTSSFSRSVSLMGSLG